MGLRYVLVKSEALGKLFFVKHADSIGKSVTRGRRSVTLPTHEIYEIKNDKGSLSVRVPVSGALKGDFYNKEIRLINPRIVNRPAPYFNETYQRNEARNRLYLEADKIELVGGKA
ncbi:hypothetical protein FEW53_002413 [Enterococcus faecalis]|nr:hypothetical protein [Enterococcus faecalis]